MRKHKILLAASLPVLLLLGVGVMKAWLPKENPHALARDVLQRMSEPVGVGGCRASITTTTVAMVDGEPVETTLQADYLAERNRLQWISEHFEVYADTTVAVVVGVNERTIYIHPSSPRELRERQRSLTANVQDALLEKGEIVEFSDVSDDAMPGADRLLVIRPDDQLRRLTMADTVIFFIDSKAGVLRKAVLDFVPGADVELVTVVYDKLEFVDRIEEFDSPILASVLDDRNRLHARYGGYRLVDLRRR